ncbi:hypothetical protein [Streptomyces sp. ID05-04B]|uniref:hypothetical protein n=1 Tax=Streptomyces sp. ID05-04B TaxID=3028661 RepID=UPI0029CA2418|nr:hypothetical protein [Streptomyces sp. ID05-04B]
MPASEETVSRLRAAVRAKNRAEVAAEKARAELAAAIAGALRDGMRPVEVIKETDYTREHIRRIARDHDVPPLREATVTAIRKQPPAD